MFTGNIGLMSLTPSSVESAYKHVSGICCFYLQGGSEWCVLWSVYVGTLIASEKHVICRPKDGGYIFLRNGGVRLQHPRSCSAPRHIGCSATSYTARSDTSLFHTHTHTHTYREAPVLYDANSVSFRSHISSAGRKMCD